MKNKWFMLSIAILLIGGLFTMHGQPDFGMYAKKTTTYSLSDMAELAVRLGSIDSFDRRGDVVCLDDFETAVLKWSVSTHDGESAGVDTTYPKSGNQDCKLALVDQAGSFVIMNKGFTLLPSSRIGAEISFAVPDSNTYFYLTLYLEDGTKLHTSKIKVDFDGGTLSYYGSDGNEHIFATGLKFTSEAYAFHTIKVVVDFSTDKYVRCLYAGVEYDLSTYSLYTAGHVVAPYIYASIQLQPRVQAVAYIYIDDFILTQNEP
jgi:hypothetical protein